MPLSLPLPLRAAMPPTTLHTMLLHNSPLTRHWLYKLVAPQAVGMRPTCKSMSQRENNLLCFACPISSATLQMTGHIPL